MGFFFLFLVQDCTVRWNGVDEPKKTSLEEDRLRAMHWKASLEFSIFFPFLAVWADVGKESKKGRENGPRNTWDDGNKGGCGMHGIC